MKNWIPGLFAALTAIATFSGCSSKEPSSVAADADQTAIEQYEATLAADQEAMSAEPPEAE